MRRPIPAASLFLVAFVLSFIMSAPAVTAAPSAIPVNPDDYALPPHALVGTWLTGTGDSAAEFTFEPDGSFLLDYELTLPAQYQSVAYLSPATGTWMPAGEMGAIFRAEQSMTHARGTFLGTVTIEGTMSLAAIGEAVIDNEITGTVTIRDASDHLITVMSLGAAQPTLTATRAFAAPVTAPLPVAAAPEPAAVLAGSIYDLSPATADLPVVASPDPLTVLAGDIYDVSSFATELPAAPSGTSSLSVLAGDIYDVAPVEASQAEPAASGPAVADVLAGDIYDVSGFGGGGALEP